MDELRKLKIDGPAPKDKGTPSVQATSNLVEDALVNTIAFAALNMNFDHRPVEEALHTLIANDKWRRCPGLREVCLYENEKKSYGLLFMVVDAFSQPGH